MWGPRGLAGVQESRAILRRCQDAHQPLATVPLHSFPSPCSDLLSLRNESTGWGSIWHLEGLPEDPQGGGRVKDGKKMQTMCSNAQDGSENKGPWLM